MWHDMRLISKEGGHAFGDPARVRECDGTGWCSVQYEKIMSQGLRTIYKYIYIGVSIDNSGASRGKEGGENAKKG